MSAPQSSNESPLRRPASLESLMDLGLVKQASAPDRYSLWWPLRMVAEAGISMGDSALAGSTERARSNFLDAYQTLIRSYNQAPTPEIIVQFSRDWENYIDALNFSSPPFDRELIDGVPGSFLLGLVRPPKVRLQAFATLGSAAENPGLSYLIAMAYEELGELDRAVETLDASERWFAGRGGTWYHESRDSLGVLEALKWARRQIEGRSDGAISSNSRSGLNPRSSRWEGVAFAHWSLTPPLALPTLGSSDRTFLHSEENAGFVRLRSQTMLAQAIHSSDSDQFESALQAALNYATTWHDTRGRAEAAWQLGLFRLKQGDRAQAQTLMSEFVDYRRDIGHVRALETKEELESLLSTATPGAASFAGSNQPRPDDNIGLSPKATSTRKKATKKNAARKVTRKKVTKRTSAKGVVSEAPKKSRRRQQRRPR